MLGDAYIEALADSADRYKCPACGCGIEDDECDAETVRRMGEKVNISQLMEESIQKISELRQELKQAQSLNTDYLYVIKCAQAEREKLAAEVTAMRESNQGKDRRIAELEAQSQEDEYVINRLSTILAGVAIALKGDELPLHRRSFHDLAEVAQTKMLEIDLLNHQIAELKAQSSQSQVSDAALPITISDISELIAIAHFLRTQQHWEARAGSKVLAEITGRLMLLCPQPSIPKDQSK